MIRVGMIGAARLLVGEAEVAASVATGRALEDHWTPTSLRQARPSCASKTACRG